MGHRDARVGRDANSRGDAGHQLEGNPVPNQVLGLLGPAAEDERIAPLEPDHHAPGRGMLEQECVDLILIERAMSARLPRADPHRRRRRQLEQPRAGQVIIDHHVGPRQRLRPAQRQQPRVARPRPHQIDHSPALTHPSHPAHPYRTLEPDAAGTGFWNWNLRNLSVLVPTSPTLMPTPPIGQSRGRVPACPTSPSGGSRTRASTMIRPVTSGNAGIMQAAKSRQDSNGNLRYKVQVGTVKQVIWNLPPHVTSVDE